MGARVECRSCGDPLLRDAYDEDSTCYAVPGGRVFLKDGAIVHSCPTVTPMERADAVMWARRQLARPNN